MAEQFNIYSEISLTKAVTVKGTSKNKRIEARRQHRRVPPRHLPTQRRPMTTLVPPSLSYTQYLTKFMVNSLRYKVQPWDGFAGTRLQYEAGGFILLDRPKKKLTRIKSDKLTHCLNGGNRPQLLTWFRTIESPRRPDSLIDGFRASRNFDKIDLV